MNADAKLNATLGRQSRVALDHAVLHFNRAAHGVDHAAELDDRAVAGAFDDASVVHGDDGVNQVTAQRPEPRERAIFVCAGEPAIAGDVRHQNRCKLAGFGHGAPHASLQNSTRKARAARLPSNAIQPKEASASHKRDRGLRSV